MHCCKSVSQIPLSRKGPIAVYSHDQTLPDILSSQSELHSVVKILHEIARRNAMNQKIWPTPRQVLMSCWNYYVQMSL